MSGGMCGTGVHVWCTQGGIQWCIAQGVYLPIYPGVYTHHIPQGVLYPPYTSGCAIPTMYLRVAISTMYLRVAIPMYLRVGYTPCTSGCTLPAMMHRVYTTRHDAQGVHRPRYTLGCTPTMLYPRVYLSVCYSRLPGCVISASLGVIPASLGLKPGLP